MSAVIAPPQAPNRTNSTFNLQIPNATGAAPKERLGDILSSLGVASILLEASKERWRKMAMVQGMLDGNPPFPPGKLRGAGMAYYPNFNTLEGKAYVSSALVPYYDLFTGAPTYVDLQLDIADKQRQDEASRMVIEEMDRVFRDASWFDAQVQKMLKDFVTFGKSFLMWEDDRRIRCKHIPAYRVLFPDRTDVDQESWEVFGVLQNLSVGYLWSMRDKSGWNSNSVLESIRQAAPYDPTTYDDYVGIQQELVDHDVYVTARLDQVLVMNIYVKEFDGRWTHQIVPLDSYRVNAGAPLIPVLDLDGPPKTKTSYDQGIQTRGAELARQGYLYHKTGRYADITHIICPFFFEVLNGSINGLSGLGKDIYAPMQLKDRMWCSRINNTFMRSTIVLQAQDARSREKMALQQLQNVTILPPGVTVQNGTIFGDIEAADVTSRSLDLLLQQNTGIYRPSFEKPQGNPEPATNFRIRAAQSTTLSNSAVNRFCKQLDQFWAEEYRRLKISDEAEARHFRKWVADRGVTKEELDRTRYVRCYRNIGAGSVFLRNESLLTLLSPQANIFPNLPADGQASLIQDAVGSLTSQQKVERYAPFASRKAYENRDAWEANEENGTMQTGGHVIGYPGQNDVVHLGVHGKAGQDAVASIKQGASVAQVFTFLQPLIRHAREAHLANLERNGKKQEAKPFLKLFDNLDKVAKQLGQGLARGMQQQQAQAQKTQQAMSDQQLKQAKAKADLQLKAQKTQAGIQLSALKTRAGIALKDATTAASIQRETHSHLASLQRDQEKAEASSDEGSGD